MLIDLHFCIFHSTSSLIPRIVISVMLTFTNRASFLSLSTFIVGQFSAFQAISLCLAFGFCTCLSGLGLCVSRRPISRRCQSISTKVSVHTFVCESSALCRSIWTTAIAQHQFFLDQKDRQRSGTAAVPVFDQHDFSDRLNRLISQSSIGSSLPSLSSLHSASSLTTMPAAKVADGSCPSLPTLMNVAPLPIFFLFINHSFSHFFVAEKSGEDRQRDVELYKILRGKKTELEDLLRSRLHELRLICLKEGEITGEMPEEINTTLRPGEEMPKLKKRIGTSFSIPEEILKSDKVRVSNNLTDVELHKRIVAAAERLAKDKTMNKSVRKKRQKDLAAAALKLRGLELGLNQMRLSASKPDVSSLECGGGVSWNAFPQQNNGTILTRAVAKSCPTTPRGSVPDLCPDGDRSDEYDDEEQVQRRLPESSSRRSLHQRFSEMSTSSNGSLGLPPRANSRRSNTTRSITSDELDNPLTNALPSTDQTPIYENIGYRSMSYRSSYRQAHYPTLQDEQYLRKRALSAHSVSHIDVPTIAGYTIRLDNATFPMSQDSKTCETMDPHSVVVNVLAPERVIVRSFPTAETCGTEFCRYLSITETFLFFIPMTPISSSRAVESARFRPLQSVKSQ
uniref:CUPID domain-containing protein n=1 Tax=Angiostrongylus cantonensis TaxID=6313 RepID=A0A158P9X5_ANGCA